MGTSVFYDQDQLKAALVELERMIHDADCSENEMDRHVTDMSGKIFDPSWMEYIFQTDEFIDDAGRLRIDDLSVKILSHQSIAL